MRRWNSFFSLAIALIGQSGSAWAQTGNFPPPATQQLMGLSPSEAASLLSKLGDAQRRMRLGDFQAFELLAGSIASYNETRITPRDAFLQVPFDRVWRVERKRAYNSLWQPYQLAYAPNGLGQLYWDIEVVLGRNGDIERVLMIYKPPAPF